MALNAGSSRTSATGLSGVIFTALSGTSWSGMLASAFTPGAIRDALAALLDAVSAGVVAALTNDAEVTVTVPANAFGPGIPPTDVPLTGSIS